MQSQRWMLYIVSHSPRLLERSIWIPQFIHGWVLRAACAFFPNEDPVVWITFVALTGEMNGVGTLTLQGASACCLTGGGKVSETQSGAFFSFFFYASMVSIWHGVPALFRIFGSRLCRKTRRLGRGQSMGSERKDGPEAGRVIIIIIIIE